ncbi:MAG: 2-oxoacid:acceptor oxidoreductase family protein [Chloroflexi bacterium]|nr:2-oxoacid:acceptor oxidoreductase family protein [Chloroflexota bacterium]
MIAPYAELVSPTSSLDITEIRWHGRGGQGIVTAGELLAQAALVESKFFQSFPEFGPERSGAPMRAYTRVSDSPISLHCPILNPNAIVVLDPTLLDSREVFEGLQEDGSAVVNTPSSPEELRRRLSLKTFRLFTVDATTIAVETIRRNIPNTPMLGALVRVLPIVTPASCIQEITRRLGSRMAPSVVEANIVAFQRGYATVREG